MATDDKTLTPAQQRVLDAIEEMDAEGVKITVQGIVNKTGCTKDVATEMRRAYLGAESPKEKIAALEQQVLDLQVAVAEAERVRDEAVAERDAALAERDAALEARAQAKQQTAEFKTGFGAMTFATTELGARMERFLNDLDNAGGWEAVLAAMGGAGAVGTSCARPSDGLRTSGEVAAGIDEHRDEHDGAADVVEPEGPSSGHPADGLPTATGDEADAEEHGDEEHGDEERSEVVEASAADDAAELGLSCVRPSDGLRTADGDGDAAGAQESDDDGGVEGAQESRTASDRPGAGLRPSSDEEADSASVRPTDALRPRTEKAAAPKQETSAEIYARIAKAVDDEIDKEATREKLMKIIDDSDFEMPKITWPPVDHH